MPRTETTAAVTAKFSKGDRVKISAKGLSILGRPAVPLSDYVPERRGTITRATPTGTGFHLLWDGRKTEDSLHGDYLELADGPISQP
jgi:hypothetical protein